MDALPYELALVIPVYNEEQVLPALKEALYSSLPDLGLSWQVIFVDDGSTDGSSELLRSLALADERITYVRFKHNQGMSTAYRAGIRAAKARFIATLDADLQLHPSLLERLLEKQREGDYDVVYCRRVQRAGNWLKRVLTSRTANWLISRLSGSNGHDAGCGLRLFRTEMARKIKFYGGLHRMTTALCKGFGAREAEVWVVEAPRAAGQSKFGLERIFKVLPDLVRTMLLTRLRRVPLAFLGKLLARLALTGCGYWLAFHNRKRKAFCFTWPTWIVLTSEDALLCALFHLLDSWRECLVDIWSKLDVVRGYPLDEDTSVRAE